MDGNHQVEVEGHISGDYLLEINPSTGFRTSPSAIALRQTQDGVAGDQDVFELLSPTPRGRNRPLTGTQPDDDIGLPDAPGVQIFLPIVIR
jgi:hypothetical protein